MMSDLSKPTGWIERETSRHQDHVIAHVIGSTVIGYFAFDESIYLLLDIGFMWQIYLDGEMGLLPCSMALQEIAIADDIRKELKADSELLLTQGLTTGGLKRMSVAPAECVVKEVGFFTDGEEWRMLLKGEENDLILKNSLASRQIDLVLADFS